MGIVKSTPINNLGLILSLILQQKSLLQALLVLKWLKNCHGLVWLTVRWLQLPLQIRYGGMLHRIFVFKRQ